MDCQDINNKSSNFILETLDMHYTSITYSRRDNLIIHGIPEPDKESPTQCEKSVKQFFVNHLNLTDQESTCCTQ